MPIFRVLAVACFLDEDEFDKKAPKEPWETPGFRPDMKLKAALPRLIDCIGKPIHQLFDCLHLSLFLVGVVTKHLGSNLEGEIEFG